MEIEREGKLGQAWGGKEPHGDNHDDDLIVCSAVATSYMCLVRIKTCWNIKHTLDFEDLVPKKKKEFKIHH